MYKSVTIICGKYFQYTVIISGSSAMLLDLRVITYAPLPPRIPAPFLPVSNIGKQSWWPESDIFPALRERERRSVTFSSFSFQRPNITQLFDSGKIVVHFRKTRKSQFKIRCLFYASKYFLSLRDDFMESW